MGLMDDAMRSDLRFASDTDQFAESVTYTRRSGTAYTLPLIVDRNAPTRDPEYGINTRLFEVQIAYDPDNERGLASAPAKGDTITLPDDPSETATTTKQYMGIVSADAGGWLVQFV